MKPVVYSKWTPNSNINPSHSCAFYVSSPKNVARWVTRDCNDFGTPFCELSMPDEDPIFPGRVPPSPTTEDLISPEVCMDVNDERLCMRLVRLQLNFASARYFCANKFNMTWSGKPLPSGENITNAVIKLMDETTVDKMLQEVSLRKHWLKT